MVLCRQQCSHAALQVQQELLPPESTAVSSKLAILVYHPMAGNQDSDAVLAVRSADCTLSASGTDLAGQSFVRARFAIRDSQELFPYGLLKRAARVDQRN